MVDRILLGVASALLVFAAGIVVIYELSGMAERIAWVGFYLALSLFTIYSVVVLTTDR